VKDMQVVMDQCEQLSSVETGEGTQNKNQSAQPTSEPQFELGDYQAK
jgi:hypothetical protein